MRYKKQQISYPLTGQSVDAAAEQIELFLLRLHLSKTEAVRVRLSMEEVLLRWIEHFDADAEVVLILSFRFSRPQIVLQLKGERFNPLVHTENEQGEWMQSLFSGAGSTPVFAYRQGVNTVLLKLPQQHRNPAATLLAALTVGAVLGLLGRWLLPQAVLDAVLRLFLAPVESAVFRTLNAVSGPVIFLSVMTAVCGVGNLSVMNSSGRRLIIRFLWVCVLITGIGAAASTLLYHLKPGVSLPESEFVSGGLDLLLQAIPNDLLTPFVDGNSPQIILGAFLIGSALLVIGSRADTLLTLLRQANEVALVVADWIGSLAPFLIGVLLILGIWNGSASVLVGLWRPLLLFVPLAALSLFASLLRVSVSKKVPIRILLQKMLPSMGTALRTASVDAAFSENLRCCTEELGVHPSLTEYSLPLGLVTYMPAGALAALLVTFYAARVYSVQITMVWVITAVVLTTVLITASPPVPGVGLLAYAAVFSQLNIPGGALTMAITADILVSFTVAAVNQAMLQTELVLEADRLHQLDFDKLRRAPARRVKQKQ